MLRAGADRVISPYQIGGRRMALSALQPMVMDFIDTLTGGRADQRIIAEFEATPESGMVGRSLDEAIMSHADALVLAIQKPSGATVVGPSHATVVEAEDRVIVLGKEADLEALAMPNNSHG
jgi:voltage-gated potassium channel